MALDERPVVCAAGGAEADGRGASRGRNRRQLHAEDGTDVRVTEVGGLRAHEHLAPGHRTQPEFLERRPVAAGATGDPAEERA
jgi:hypothetical protein